MSLGNPGSIKTKFEIVKTHAALNTKSKAAKK